MNNFIQRTLSGAIYVALVVASILVDKALFGALFVICTMLAIREFHVLMKSSKGLTYGSMIAGGALFGILHAICLYPMQSMAWLPIVVIGYIILVVSILIAELFTKAANPIQNWGNMLQSQIMVALPFAMMNYVYSVGAYWLLTLFITIWVNDSGAYCVGSLLAKRKGGNHKMFPRVSPGKSWEGLIGGIAFALLAGYVYSILGWIPNVSIALVYTFVIAIFGTLGDLMESLMKRTIGVKDSGKFMPGHGGVLDRFDSILLATPVVAIVLFFFSLAL